MSHPAAPTPCPLLDAAEHARWAEDALPQLRQLLYWRWDPIGVSDQFPLSAREYDAYAMALIALMRTGADRRQIARHLAGVERAEMGLPGRSEDLLEVGSLIETWHSNSLWGWRAGTSEA